MEFPCLDPKKPPHVCMPSKNFGMPRGTYGRAGSPILAIVVHCVKNTMAAYDALACSDLKLTRSLPDHASLHYLVGRTGVIHQYVDDLDMAWAFTDLAGQATPNLTTFNWAHVTANPGINPDRYTINIGLEVGVNYTDQCAKCEGCFSPLPEYAEKKLTQLIAYLVHAHGIDLNSTNVVFHQDVDVLAENECSCADRQKMIACVADYCEQCEHPDNPAFKLGQVKWLYGIDEHGCLVKEELMDALARLGLDPTVIDCAGFNFTLNGFAAVGNPTTANVTGLTLPSGDSVVGYRYSAYSMSNGAGLILASGVANTFSTTQPGIRSIVCEITTARGCVLAKTFNF